MVPCKSSSISSGTISVFQVSRTKMRISAPFGASKVFPTPAWRWPIRLGESGLPKSERSGRNLDHATLCGENILHVDYDERRLGNIDPNSFRFCVKVDDAALHAPRHSDGSGWFGSLSGYVGRPHYTADRGCHCAGSHKSASG